MSEPARRIRPPATPEQVAAIGSAVRLRILRLCLRRPMTNRELAQRLDMDPATTLYHVRRLVDCDLLEAQQPRRGNRGAREIPYLARGVTWELEWSAADRARKNEAMFEAFLAEVTEVGVERLEQTRAVLQLDAAAVADFQSRLHDLVDEFVRRAPAADEPRHAVYVAVYPGD